MKKILLSIAVFAMSATVNAQVKTPAPSPGQTVKQDFGLSSIELSYSRPGVKGRKVFGDLVPFGKVWRTGANNATTLTFGDDVIIGGKTIPAGKYGLLSIPDKTVWTLILTRQIDVTSPAAYKQEEDMVRVSVKPVILPVSVETMTISFHDIAATTCKLYIAWDKTAVSLPIATEIDSKVMAAIETSMKSEKPAYAQAASYFLENGKDINKAIEWYEKAVEIQPRAFWLKYQLARAYAKAGKKSQAKDMAVKSTEQAKDAKNEDYVKLNEKLLSELK